VGGGAKEGVYNVEIVEPATNLGLHRGRSPTASRSATARRHGFRRCGELHASPTARRHLDLRRPVRVTVSQLTRKYKILAPAATDGTQIAAGILLADADATAADAKIAVVSRSAEVNANELTYPGGDHRGAEGHCDRAAPGRRRDGPPLSGPANPLIPSGEKQP
jgi:hypothetical protein